MASSVQAPPRGTPCWLDIASPDVEASKAFYARLFGWSYEVSSAQYGPYHTALIDSRNVAGLWELDEEDEGDERSEVRRTWTVFLRADDTDAMVRIANDLGGTTISPPREVPSQGRFAVLRDPDGAVFGLWEPIRHNGFGVTHELGAFGWAEVNVPDADAARGFYTKLTGASARTLDSDGLPMRYDVLSIDGKDAFGLLQMTEEWEGVPPHWMPYIEVENCDAVATEAKAAGGTVPVPPFDTPYGRIAVLNDPFGAVLSVNQTDRT